MGLLDVFSSKPAGAAPAPTTAGLLSAPNRAQWTDYRTNGGDLSYADWAKQQAAAAAAAQAAQKK